MFRWLLACVVLCAAAFAGVHYGIPELQRLGYITGWEITDDTTESVDGPATKSETPKNVQPSIIESAAAAGPRRVAKVAPDGRLLVTDKQEVPSERDGQLMVIGTEVRPGETVSPNKRLTARVGFLALAMLPGDQVPADKQIVFPGIKRKYRRWKEGDPFKHPSQRDGKSDPEEKDGPFLIVAEEMREYRRLDVGDEVKSGQMVALVDPTLAIKEMAIKNSQVNAAEADVLASYKTKVELLRRYEAMEKSIQRVPGSVSKDDLEGTRLQYEKYAQEQVAKEAAVIKAQQELLQSIAILGKHEVRATIDGTVKMIYKNRGDAVKNLDPILQIQNPKRLRVETVMEIHETGGMKPGMEVIVEPSRPEQPRLVLRGHLLEVTCVAVSKGARPVIVSGSEDRTLRGWDATDGRQLWQLPYTVAVRSVACSPKSGGYNLSLAGWADGTARLINLDNLKDAPRELGERHRGAVTCVAFSPDGETCATGSEDRSICLWETSTGKLLHRLPAAHRAAVTSLQFAAGGQLVSAGRDNTMVLWSVETGKPPLRVAESDRRSGDVAQLGVSPDGKRVLFDQGKELRILSLSDRQIEGVLHSPSTSTSFTTMALFSPDGNTILTNVAAEGRIQLWRAPDATQPRAAEVRQFVWTTGQATCGAFAPDSSFAVTGTQDNRVLVWPMPSKEEIGTKLTARLTLVEQSIEGSSRQVRVWAELENPGWLVPGSTATLVVLPEMK